MCQSAERPAVPMKLFSDLHPKGTINKIVQWICVYPVGLFRQVETCLKFSPTQFDIREMVQELDYVKWKR